MSPIQVLRRGVARRVELVPMNPLEQLRAGRLVHRVSQLLVGLVLFGVSMALLLRADLGLEPWGVLQYGLIQHIPMSYGAMSIVVSFVVLLLWIPLRQWPGLGTVLNAVVIGVATTRPLPSSLIHPGFLGLAIGSPCRRPSSATGWPARCTSAASFAPGRATA